MPKNITSEVVAAANTKPVTLLMDELLEIDSGENRKIKRNMYDFLLDALSRTDEENKLPLRRSPHELIGYLTFWTVILADTDLSRRRDNINSILSKLFSAFPDVLHQYGFTTDNFLEGTEFLLKEAQWGNLFNNLQFQSEGIQATFCMEITIPGINLGAFLGGIKASGYTAFHDALESAFKTTIKDENGELTRLLKISSDTHSVLEEVHAKGHLAAESVSFKTKRSITCQWKNVFQDVSYQSGGNKPSGMHVVASGDYALVTSTGDIVDYPYLKRIYDAPRESIQLNKCSAVSSLKPIDGKIIKDVIVGGKLVAIPSEHPSLKLYINLTDKNKVEQQYRGSLEKDISMIFQGCVCPTYNAAGGSVCVSEISVTLDAYAMMDRAGARAVIIQITEGIPLCAGYAPVLNHWNFEVTVNMTAAQQFTLLFPCGTNFCFSGSAGIADESNEVACPSLRLLIRGTPEVSSDLSPWILSGGLRKASILQQLVKTNRDKLPLCVDWTKQRNDRQEASPEEPPSNSSMFNHPNDHAMLPWLWGPGPMHWSGQQQDNSSKVEAASDAMRPKQP